MVQDIVTWWIRFFKWLLDEKVTCLGGEGPPPQVTTLSSLMAIGVAEVQVFHLSSDLVIKRSHDLVEGVAQCKLPLCQVWLSYVMCNCRYKDFHFSRDQVVKRSRDLVDELPPSQVTTLPSLAVLGLMVRKM